MPITLLMPALSPTMTEGTLARWLKKEGDPVKSGDVLAEIETDKATMEMEAVDEGTLGRILVPEGTAGVAVNTPIALLLEEGEDAAALDGAAPAKAPAPTKAKDEGGVDPQVLARLRAMVGDDDEPAPAKASAPAAAPAKAKDADGFDPQVLSRLRAMVDDDAPAAPDKGERIFASPLARRIADQKGLDLAAIPGSGPHGRIVKADVEAASVTAPTVAKAAPAQPLNVSSSLGEHLDAKLAAATLAQANPFEPAFVEEKLSSMRRTIASRLTESKTTIPHFYLSADCRIDALLKVRAELNERPGGHKLSVNDFVVRAVALALQKVPAANAAWGETVIRRYTDVDISVAVATDGGLITPVVRHADQKGLAVISAEIKTLAAKARDGKLRPEEYQGGGFTISNLGMYGIKEFSAIINPPQACILAVGAGEARPVVKDGALAIATVMTCTLSVDHRVVDGAVGAEFMAAFKGLIEDPLSMLL